MTGTADLDTVYIVDRDCSARRLLSSFPSEQGFLVRRRGCDNHAGDARRRVERVPGDQLLRGGEMSSSYK